MLPVPGGSDEEDEAMCAELTREIDGQRVDV